MLITCIHVLHLCYKLHFVIRLDREPHLFEVFVELACQTVDSESPLMLQQYPEDYSDQVNTIYE